MTPGKNLIKIIVCEGFPFHPSPRGPAASRHGPQLAWNPGWFLPVGTVVALSLDVTEQGMVLGVAGLLAGLSLVQDLV